MAVFLLVRPGVDEGAQASMSPLVDKVNQVVGDGVKAGGQTLVLNNAIEFQPGHCLFPYNGISSLDIEVDQKQGRYGRQVGKDSRGRRLGQSHGEGRLSPSVGGHGGCLAIGGRAVSAVLWKTDG